MSSVEIFSLKQLYQAYLACRKRKRATSQAQHYELHLLDELVLARERLQNKSWQPRRSTCFVTTRPKAREIHAAAFADRVIHHLLAPHLEAIYEPIFIYDSYSNRKNKGTHKAVQRLQQFMRKVTCNQKRRAYYLQLDIHNFFNSINKRLLFDLLKHRLTMTASPQRTGSHKLTPETTASPQRTGGHKLTHETTASPQRTGGHKLTHETTASPQRTGSHNEDNHELLWLCRTLLVHNPCANVKEFGSAKIFAQVPPHKRLKNAPPATGLPIGNLTSQVFANVYLNELDQFVKHELKCRHYLRYVDDFILLHDDKAQLEAWREAIITFLHERLALRLKDAGKLQPVANGADFLGYIVRPHYCLVRRRVVGNLREKLNRFEKQMTASPQRTGSHKLTPETTARPLKDGQSCPVDDVDLLHATIASYLGHFRHASSYRLTRALWQQYPWLSRYFRLTFPLDYRNKAYPKLIFSPYFRYMRKQKRRRISCL